MYAQRKELTISPEIGAIACSRQDWSQYGKLGRIWRRDEELAQYSSHKTKEKKKKRCRQKCKNGGKLKVRQTGKLEGKFSKVFWDQKKWNVVERRWSLTLWQWGVCSFLLN